MKFKSISNWPFTAKFAVPSAISLAMICIVALVSYLALNGQVKLTKTIVERDFQSALTLVEANMEVQEVNGQLYKILTDQAAEITGSTEAAGKVAARSPFPCSCPSPGSRRRRAHHPHWDPIRISMP